MKLSSKVLLGHSMNGPQPNATWGKQSDAHEELFKWSTLREFLKNTQII